jgi:sulfite exporter TauE/SafE
MKKTLHIRWMHCISCEIILSKELKKLSWFTIHQINHKKWILEAEYLDENQLKLAIELIKKHWFSVDEDVNNLKNNVNIQDILVKIIFLLFISIIFYLLTIFVDVNSLIPQNQNGSYLTTFIIGIIASLSTCLAVTGWIVIWFSKAFSSRVSGMKWSAFIQTLFQLGRLGGFFILWGLLWLVGEFFSISLQFSTILTLFISFVLIYIWLQILWFVPNISRFGFHLPKSFSNNIEKLKNPKMAPVVWALTFFIPCGFTQSAQLLAISSWDFYVGGLIMLFFALWTFPVLFLVWLWSSYFSWKKFPFIEMILWIIILLFWIHTFSNAYNLIPSFFNVDTQQQEVLQNNQSYETIYANHNGWNIDGFEINLQEWKNYKVIITPERNWMGCMGTLTIPTLSNKIHNVIQWRPIVYDFVNAKKWEYKIVCSSMWMTQWAIIVK